MIYDDNFDDDGIIQS